MIPKSNLIIQTAFLGDLILSIPILKRIKVLFPEDRLVVVCKQGLGDFLLKENLVDEVLELKKSNSNSYKEALIILKSKTIRNIFCIHKSVRSQLFTAQIKAEKKIGFYSIFNSFFGFLIFDKLVTFNQKYPEVIRQFKILEPVDVQTREEINAQDFSYLNHNYLSASNKFHLPAVPSFFSFHPEDFKKLIIQTDTPKENGPKKIALFPGSVWATKMWTREGFTGLCQLLLQQQYEVHLMGGPTEKNLCEEIALKAKGVKVLAGQFSIAETLNQLSSYDLVISNDSAPTHMAAYKNIPVITLFGPTTLSQGFRPWSNRARIVENTNMECRPCGKHGHRECPLGHHRCMTSIESQVVFLQVQETLNT